MKKFAALILALVFCLMATSALAETEKLGSLTLMGVDGGADAWIQAIDDHLLNVHGQEGVSLPNAERVYYDNMMTLLLALGSQDITMASLRLSTARYLTSRSEEYRVAFTDDRTLEEFSMMVMEENKELYDQLNQAIIDLKADGTLAQIVDEHITRCVAGGDPRRVEMPVFEGAPTIKVAVTGDVPPMDYVEADGTPSGFNVALLSKVAQKLNVNIELVSMDSSARGTALATGRVDVIFWSKSQRCNLDGCTEVIPVREMVPGAITTEAYFSDGIAGVVLK